MEVMHNNKNTLRGLLLLAGMGLSGLALAHGDVVPQAVNTEGLEPLGKEWRETNPYRAPYEKNALAVEIGASAYNQNCARCHGLEAKSGGIAPDLRYLETDASGDEWFKERVTTAPFAMGPCTCRRWPTSSARKRSGPSVPTWKASTWTSEPCAAGCHWPWGCA
jgi:cytochrome c-550 PedF